MTPATWMGGGKSSDQVDSTAHGSATHDSTTHDSTTHGSTTHDITTHDSTTHDITTHDSTTHASTPHDSTKAQHNKTRPTQTSAENTMTSNPFNPNPKRWRPGSNSRARAANRAWHAPRPRAWAVVVESMPVEITADTEHNLQRTAGLWGTRRPSGGRALRALVRGRRRTQRVRPRGAAPNPNLACRSVIDFMGFDAEGNPQYALLLSERGGAPEVVLTLDHPGKVAYRAGRFLQPGLVTEISEVALLSLMLHQPIWVVNSPDRGAEAASDADLPRASLESELKRPAIVANGMTVITKGWLETVFGPRLSMRRWRRLRAALRQRRQQCERQQGPEPGASPESQAGPEAAD
jgi:hypothetical protein